MHTQRQQHGRDAALRAVVLDELLANAGLDASQVDVAVADGVVTLVGTVGSVAEKNAARVTTRSVPGVHDLIDELGVKPLGDVRPSDVEVAEMIGYVLTWDALVPEERLTVAVADGVVTLSGSVAVASQAREAERVVSRLQGIRGVHNEIVVTEPDLVPSDVRSAIVDALHHRADHRATHIDVTVDGGQVILSGGVQSAGERAAILGAVSHEPGVATVVDELVVEPHD